jgi:hypothetical protein
MVADPLRTLHCTQALPSITQLIESSHITWDDIFGPVREIVADFSGVIKALNCTKINLNGLLQLTWMPPNYQRSLFQFTELRKALFDSAVPRYNLLGWPKIRPLAFSLSYFPPHDRLWTLMYVFYYLALVPFIIHWAYIEWTLDPEFFESRIRNSLLSRIRIHN